MKTKSIILMSLMFLLTESFAFKAPDHIVVAQKSEKEQELKPDDSESNRQKNLEIKQRIEAILVLNEKIKKLERRIQVLEKNERKPKIAPEHERKMLSECFDIINHE